MLMKWILILGVHVIGAVLCLIRDTKNGNFQWVAHNGDGVRFATPADLFLDDILLWELNLFIKGIDKIDDVINEHFYKKYEK